MPRAWQQPNLVNVRQICQRAHITGVTYMPLAMKRLIKHREIPYQSSINHKRHFQSLMKMSVIAQDLKFQIFKHNIMAIIELLCMTKEQLASVNLRINKALKILNVPQRNKIQPFSKTKHLS